MKHYKSSDFKVMLWSLLGGKRLTVLELEASCWSSWTLRCIGVVNK